MVSIDRMVVTNVTSAMSDVSRPQPQQVCRPSQKVVLQMPHLVLTMQQLHSIRGTPNVAILAAVTASAAESTIATEQVFATIVMVRELKKSKGTSLNVSTVMVLASVRSVEVAKCASAARATVIYKETYVSQG